MIMMTIIAVIALAVIVTLVVIGGGRYDDK